MIDIRKLAKPICQGSTEFNQLPFMICAGCGNGFVDSGEECDDQNRVDGDGCSVACAIE